jgi:hypothetical protein
MTVDEGRRAIDEMNANGQVEGESSRSGGQGRSTQTKERHCGGCGKTGHNARTCQIVVAISGEEYNVHDKRVPQTSECNT